MINDTEIKIRFAHPEEVGEVETLVSEMIAELHGTEASEQLMGTLKSELSEAIGDNPDDTLCVASIDNRLIGCGRARILSDHPMFRFRKSSQYGYIELMFVKPDFRGRWLGRAILKVLEQWLYDRGVEYVTLHHSRSSFEFYKNSGYSYFNEMVKELAIDDKARKKSHS